MSTYFPEEPEFAQIPPRFKEKGVKWRQAVDLVEKILLMSAAMERFAVLGLTADDATNGRLIVKPSSGSVWFTKDGEGAFLPEITKVSKHLRAISPDGGSAHFLALERAFRYVDLALDEGPADTIILITDGLPNHGPGAPAPNAADALVAPEQRRLRAEKVTTKIRDLFADLENRQPSHLVRLHVICLAWPDDADLSYYALQWSYAGGGMMLFLPPDI